MIKIYAIEYRAHRKGHRWFFSKHLREAEVDALPARPRGRVKIGGQRHIYYLAIDCGVNPPRVVRDTRGMDSLRPLGFRAPECFVDVDGNLRDQTGRVLFEGPTLPNLNPIS